MNRALAAILIPASLASLGIVAVVAWAMTVVRLEARKPGQDGAPPAAEAKTARRTTPGQATAGPGIPSTITTAWPWFRGPNRDAIAQDSVKLARKWPASGPKRLWMVEAGDGYAGAVIDRGRVYLLDHAHDFPMDLVRGLTDADRQRLADALTAISAAELDRAEPLLKNLFPHEAVAGRASVTTAQYDLLKKELGELLATRRDDLLRALRKNTLDDVDRSADVMRCLSLDDGREIWRNSYPVIVPPHHGMSRTVPAVVGNAVISLGPLCQVACWDADKGNARWLIDLVLDHGTTVPPWYAGQCPLVDDKTDRLILAPGGKALVVAVDYTKGEIVWQSPNPRGWTMTHVSVVPMELAGRRMYVYCGRGGVAGVAADTGEILWETTEWQIGTATCPSPVPVGDGRIFFSGGYNAGALMLQVAAENGRFTTKTLWKLTARKFGSEQHTPVLYQNHLYGVRQKDQQFVCLDLEGRERWTSGRDKFGSAPYMIADGLLLAMNDEGLLTLAEATPEAYRRLDQAEVIPEGVTSWAPMALAAGRLIVRDMNRIVCLDVAKEKHLEAISKSSKIHDNQYRTPVFEMTSQ